MILVSFPMFLGTGCKVLMRKVTYHPSLSRNQNGRYELFVKFLPFCRVISIG